MERILLHVADLQGQLAKLVHEVLDLIAARAGLPPPRFLACESRVGVVHLADPDTGDLTNAIDTLRRHGCPVFDVTELARESHSANVSEHDV